MKFSFFGGKATEPVTLLDIGSEAVKAFVVKKEGGKTVLLAKSLQYLDPFRVWDPPLEIGEGRGDDKFESGMVQEFTAKAVEEARKRAGQKSKNVIVALSPLIFKVFLKNVEVKRAVSSQPISGREEREILSQIRHKLTEFVTDHMSKQYGLGRKELFFVSLGAIGFTLDGYKVPSLRGLGGKDIGATGLVWVLPRKYIGKSGVPSFLSKVKPLHFGGFVHQSKYFAHPTFSYQDGIFIDIGGRTSEVFVIKDKTLSGVWQVEAGSSDFTKIISEDLGLNESRARELKASYASGGVSPGVSLKLKKKVGPMLSGWASEISRCLVEAMGPLPPDFFLFGGGSLLPEFKDVLEEGLNGVPLSGSPKVKFLAPTDLPGLEHKNILDETLQETPVLLLSYLI